MAGQRSATTLIVVSQPYVTFGCDSSIARLADADQRVVVCGTAKGEMGYDDWIGSSVQTARAQFPEAMCEPSGRETNPFIPPTSEARI